jgi:hypothetical protein
MLNISDQVRSLRFLQDQNCGTAQTELAVVKFFLRAYYYYVLLVVLLVVLVVSVTLRHCFLHQSHWLLRESHWFTVVRVTGIVIRVTAFIIDLDPASLLLRVNIRR